VWSGFNARARETIRTIWATRMLHTTRERIKLPGEVPMGSAIRLGRIAGIPVQIDVSFFLALPLLAYLFAQQFVAAARLVGIPQESIGGDRYLWGLAVALALFASVLLHELAHSLYARRTGSRVSAITLLMIGGVSQIEDSPRRPRDEAVMALLGPLTSLAIAAVLRATLVAVPRDMDLWEVRFVLGFTSYLNLTLGVFNLLPAFPMDGGRVLRALLVKRLGLPRATRTASLVGKAFALIFAALGAISGNLILILVAWFVYVGAQQETAQVETKEALGSIRVADLLQPDGPAIDGRATLADAAEQLLRARRLALPVLVDGSFAGMLSADDIGRVAPAARARSLSADFVRRVPPLGSNSPAWEALQAMFQAGVPEIVVVSPDGAPLGTVSRADIERALRLAELQRSTTDGRASLRKRMV
jgi:Zn-dependent protease/CBS domain-containing protein